MGGVERGVCNRAGSTERFRRVDIRAIYLEYGSRRPPIFFRSKLFRVRQEFGGRKRVERLGGQNSRVRGVRAVVTGVLLGKLVETRRSTRTVLVLFRLGLLLVDVVEKGSEDLPGDVELVVTDKVRVVTLDRVKDEGSGSAKNDVRSSCTVGHYEAETRLTRKPRES